MLKNIRCVLPLYLTVGCSKEIDQRAFFGADCTFLYVFHTLRQIGKIGMKRKKHLVHVFDGTDGAKAFNKGREVRIGRVKLVDTLAHYSF